LRILKKFIRHESNVSRNKINAESNKSEKLRKESRKGLRSENVV